MALLTLTRVSNLITRLLTCCGFDKVFANNLLRAREISRIDSERCQSETSQRKCGFDKLPGQSTRRDNVRMPIGPDVIQGCTGLILQRSVARACAHASVSEIPHTNPKKNRSKLRETIPPASFEDGEAFVFYKIPAKNCCLTDGRLLINFKARYASSRYAHPSSVIRLLKVCCSV